MKLREWLQESVCTSAIPYFFPNLRGLSASFIISLFFVDSRSWERRPVSFLLQLNDSLDTFDLYLFVLFHDIRYVLFAIA